MTGLLRLGNILMTVLLLVTPLSAWAGESVWNAQAGKTPGTQAPSPDLDGLALRVYVNADGSTAIAGQEAYALDVVPDFIRCPDGSRVVGGLRIGGKPYQLDSRCPAQSVGSGEALLCNPETWTCARAPENLPEGAGQR
jgi:hypothetical protein